MEEEHNMPPGFKPADFGTPVSFNDILAVAEMEFESLGLAPVIIQKAEGLLLSMREVDPAQKSFDEWKRELEKLPMALLEKYPAAFEAFVPFK